MIVISDSLAGSIIPASVIFHALSGVAGTAWTVVELDVTGDLSLLHPGNVDAINRSLPLNVTWHWLETFSTLVDDIEWLKVIGVDQSGRPLQVSCVDSTVWEVAGAPDLEASLRGHFHDVTDA